MHVRKAVITAAARSQRQLPLQVLTDRDGTQRCVLELLVREAISAGIEEVCVVIAPGDKASYSSAAGAVASALTFAEQAQPNGYGDAILCAAPFVGNEPFLHFVGDHLFLPARSTATSSARLLVQTAVREQCSVSAVQPTREHALPYYGTIGGRRIHPAVESGTAASPGAKGGPEVGGGLYEVESVMEKPTPTEAEQTLLVPGLRAGHYLCFVGMHVLTPGVVALLRELKDGKPTLSDALAQLARRERYLALETNDIRYNVGVKHGLLIAQLALTLSGPDRDYLLTQLVDLLARDR